MKNYTKETFKSRDEWIQNRGFGGSSASAILGVNPYMTTLDIYCAFVNASDEVKDHSKETINTIYGTECEPIMRKLVELNYKDKFKVHTPRNFEMYRRKDRPYMTATLDGIMTENETKDKWVLEIKTHELKGNSDLEKWKVKLPQNYYIQLIHYLSVMSDYVGAILVAKLRDVDYETGDIKKEYIFYYKVERKDVLDDIAFLENAEKDFYENHIAKELPPDIEIDF